MYKYSYKLNAGLCGPPLALSITIFVLTLIVVLSSLPAEPSSPQLLFTGTHYMQASVGQIYS